MNHPLLSLLPRIFASVNERDLVALMLQHTPGANVDVDDIRTRQAAVAWWNQLGGDDSFKAYLEPIPSAPDFAALRKEFPQLDLPLLVDPRLGHVRTAQLAGLKYAEHGYTDNTLEPLNDRHRLPTDVPYWALAHDGTSNLGRPPPDCFADCTGRLLAGTADVLLAIWLQYGPRNHGMDGPGSVHTDARELCAYVNPFGAPALRAFRRDVADALFGAVVFVRG